MLRIYFLNVGHGDCTIIEHPSGRITMVDINNGEDLDDESYAEILAECQPIVGAAAYPTTLAALRQSIPRPSATPAHYGFPAISELAKHRLPHTSAYYSDPFRGLLDRPIPVNRKAQLTKAGYDIDLTNPVDFFVREFPGKEIFRYVQTHPDLDHMRGLAAIKDRGIRIRNFWDASHEKIPEFKNSSDKLEWSAYQYFRSGVTEATVLRLFQGGEGSYWNSDPSGNGNHDGIEILSPTREIARRATQQGNWNNLSYVLRINYLGYRIVLGGDADESIWEALADDYGDDLWCNVYKASHHGRDSGYSAKAMRLMAPSHTVVSVGKKPQTDASNKYRNYCANVWSTRWYGNLTLQISRENGMEWFAEHVRER
jgi:beta-lactamase superfamily II metal-dependent hydrolase